jgi:prepilin-type N-terminal cleavage/methylation domain-containing protein
MSALRDRVGLLRGEAGMTLIELLVALVMGLVVVGGATTLMISAVRKQPEQQKQAESISTARYELERMTREIRNGASVTSATASSVSFVARMRRTACGGSSPTNPATPSIQCQVVYSCTATSCTRTEREVGKTIGGTTTTIVSDIESAEVFCFVPSANADPTECGPVKSGTPPTYIGVTLRVPHPSERGNLTVSDGASLRGATLES